MKKKRRIISLLLCGVLLSFGLPRTAFAAENYNISVGGKAVTSDNLSGNGWVYDPVDNILTLTGADIDYSGGNGIHCEADVTIKVVGSNTVSSSTHAGIFIAEGCTLTITSDDKTSNTLTVTGNNGSAGIGGYQPSLGTKKACGSISIENVTVSASSQSTDVLGSYAPGIGNIGSALCGTITIDNAIVHAYGFGSEDYFAPAIGSGKFFTEDTAASVPVITICNQSEVHAHRGAYSGNSYADYIGRSGSNNNPQSGAIQADVAECKIYLYTGDTRDNMLVFSNTNISPVRTVNFVTSYGSAPAMQYIAQGGKVNTPTKPSATGYSFDGWYKEAACTNAWNFQTDTVTGNTTLYAKWSVCTHTGNTTPPSHTENTLCSVCGGTIAPVGHTFDLTVVSEDYLKSAADCTNPAVYYKSCSCSLSSKGTAEEATFTDGDPLGHQMSTSYGDTTRNAQGHWTKCAHCDYASELEQHSFDGGNTCTVCGYIRQSDNGSSTSGNTDNGAEGTSSTGGNTGNGASGTSSTGGNTGSKNSGQAQNAASPQTSDDNALWFWALLAVLSLSGIAVTTATLRHRRTM